MLLLDLPLQGQDGLATAPDDRVTPALAGLAVDPTTIRLAITEAGKGAATLETGKRLPPYPVNLEHEFHLNDRPKTVPDFNGHLRRTSIEALRRHRLPYPRAIGPLPPERAAWKEALFLRRRR